MGSGVRFRVGIALSAIGEGLREAARDFGGASLRCVCLPLSPAGSGHPPHRFITPSRLKRNGAKNFLGAKSFLRATNTMLLGTMPFVVEALLWTTIALSAVFVMYVLLRRWL